MATNKKPTNPTHQKLIYGFYLLLVILFVVLLIKQRDNAVTAWHAAGHANVFWLASGFGAMLMTIPCAAAVYRNLSPRPLPFWRTTTVQAAGLFVNKLLPAGSGAIGTSYVYLRAQRVPTVSAAAVVATNNLLGFLGHMLLLGILVLVTPSELSNLALPTVNWWWVVVAIGLISIVGLLLQTKLQSGMQRSLRQIAPIVISRPARLSLAFFFSVCITLGYAFSLLAATKSLGLELSFVHIMVALSFAVLGTSVIPVPGGIGAAEAGVYLGLVAEGVSSESALVAAILFRLLSFWLPLVIGLAAFVIATRRKYLTF